MAPSPRRQFKQPELSTRNCRSAHWCNYINKDWEEKARADLGDGRIWLVGDFFPQTFDDSDVEQLRFKKNVKVAEMEAGLRGHVKKAAHMQHLVISVSYFTGLGFCNRRLWCMRAGLQAAWDPMDRQVSSASASIIILIIVNNLLHLTTACCSAIRYVDWIRGAFLALDVADSEYEYIFT